MIDPAAITALDFGQPEQAYVGRDAIIYALGVGLGSDPLDRADLAFLDERALSVLPTFAVTLCSPGMWVVDPALGIDYVKLVHFAQSADFFHALPPKARVRGEAKVVSLTDRGEGRGAVLVLERRIFDADDGKLYCRLHQTLLLRGNGGFGGPPTPRNDVTLPEGEPELVARFATSPRAALIYRLSGDWNPLHFDPAVATKAGFPRPILHGLASYGIAGAAVSRAMGHDPVKLARLGCRFSGIVLPGDELEFRIWRLGDGTARFSAHVGDRKVLDGGEIGWREQ